LCAAIRSALEICHRRRHLNNLELPLDFVARNIRSSSFASQLFGARRIAVKASSAAIASAIFRFSSV